MQTHKLNKKAIAVTGLPEGADIAGVVNNSIYYYSGSCMRSMNDYPYSELLPSGNWRILGFAQDLKEEDWKRVVSVKWCNKTGKHWYPDYSLDAPAGWTVTSSLASGHSLLKLNDLFIENPHNKPEEHWYYKRKEDGQSWGDYYFVRWQSAQLLTNPLILIIE